MAHIGAFNGTANQFFSFPSIHNFLITENTAFVNKFARLNRTTATTVQLTYSLIFAPFSASLFPTYYSSNQFASAEYYAKMPAQTAAIKAAFKLMDVRLFEMRS